MGFLNKGNGDEAKDYLEQAYAFDLMVRRVTDVTGALVGTEAWSFLGRFVIKNKNPSELKRGLKVQNLPLARYTFELRPVPKRTNSQTNRILGDGGTYATYSTGVSINGKELKVTYENGGTISDSRLDKLIAQDVLKRATSADNGAPIEIASVNEVVLPGDIGKSGDYPRVALACLKFQASERLTGAPEIGLLIPRGRIVRQHLATGLASVSSSSTTLVDPVANFNTLPSLGLYVRNLDKHTQAVVTAKAGISITSAALNWTKGDRYLVFSLGSSNYYPDIFCDTLINPDGGLGATVNGDAFVDYPSIVASRQFCVNNNLFWDGLVTSRSSWAQWATQEAASSLLFPARIDGRFALIPEVNKPPVAIFNESNILKNSYQEEYVNWESSATNKVTVSYTEGSTGRFNARAVTVYTPEAASGSEHSVEESLDLPSITNRDQAIKVGKLFLRTKRLQNKAIKFDTATQALFLMPGDLIVVQHSITEYSLDISGYALRVTEFNAGTQMVELSRQPDSTLDGSYKASVYYRGEADPELAVQTGISFTPLVIDSKVQLRLTGLSQAVSIGDPLVLSESRVEERTYRAQSVDYNSESQATVTAVIWYAEMLDGSSLVVRD